MIYAVSPNSLTFPTPSLLRRWTPGIATCYVLRKCLINRHPVIVERGRLQNDSRGARKHGKREYVEEEPIQHHGHELPILFHLNRHGNRIAGYVLVLHEGSTS